MISSDDRIRSYLTKTRAIADVVDDLGRRAAGTRQHATTGLLQALVEIDRFVYGVGSTLHEMLADGRPVEEDVFERISDDLENFDRLLPHYAAIVESLEEISEIIDELS